MDSYTLAASGRGEVTTDLKLVAFHIFEEESDQTELSVQLETQPRHDISLHTDVPSRTKNQNIPVATALPTEMLESRGAPSGLPIL